MEIRSGPSKGCRPVVARAPGRISRATVLLSGLLLLNACESMSAGQQGAATGAALGTGISMVAGGGLATTIGAGLIGGAAGYLGGKAVGGSN
jgi:hypothetical protein